MGRARPWEWEGDEGGGGGRGRTPETLILWTLIQSRVRTLHCLLSLLSFVQASVLLRIRHFIYLPKILEQMVPLIFHLMLRRREKCGCRHLV